MGEAFQTKIILVSKLQGYDFFPPGMKLRVSKLQNRGKISPPLLFSAGIQWA